MFGHIKKVYIDRSGESGDIWLQASSGMYLLPFANVAPDYRDELVNFLETNNIDTERLLIPTDEHARGCVRKDETEDEVQLAQNASADKDLRYMQSDHVVLDEEDNRGNTEV